VLLLMGRLPMGCIETKNMAALDSDPSNPPTFPIYLSIPGLDSRYSSTFRMAESVPNMEDVTGSFARRINLPKSCDGMNSFFKSRKKPSENINNKVDETSIVMGYRITYVNVFS